MIVTTSWDDGHSLDLRLADLMVKYGIAGTFYVPERNIEGRPTLSAAQLRTIASEFEIGGHTRNHVRLHKLPLAEAEEEVLSGKAFIETLLGRAIQGFCYPGGFYTSDIKRIVSAAGYDYGRTTVNLCVGMFGDPFEMPTTLQFYPRFGVRNLKSFARYGQFAARLPALSAVIRVQSLTLAMQKLLNVARRHGGYLHLWGHSWEIDELGLWRQLEDVFKYLHDNIRPVEWHSNGGALQAVMRQNKMYSVLNN